MTRTKASRQDLSGTNQPGQEARQTNDEMPRATSVVRAAAKTDEQDSLHRHSDPYGRESDDVQQGITTVTPGTASYVGPELSPQAQRPIWERAGVEERQV